MPTTRRPEVLVVFSVIAFVVLLLLALIGFLDQHQRINDPQRYAENRCRATLGSAAFTRGPGIGTPQIPSTRFNSCVAKEKRKSTIASIFPLFVTGVVVAILGVSGLVVGRSQVRTHDAVVKKLMGN